MLKIGHFYRRSEKLFEGVLLERLVLNLTVDTAGYIRTTGKDILNVRGVSNKGVDLQETISKRISSTQFNHINYIEPAPHLTFLGSVNFTDSSGSAIPVNTLLYTLPVEVVDSYFTNPRQSTPIRTQEEIGVTPVDNAILLIVRFQIAENLRIGDRVVIESDTLVIRNLRKISEGHWQVQTILKSPV